MKPKNLIRGSEGIKRRRSFLFFPFAGNIFYDNTARSLYCTNNCKVTLIAEESQC